MSTTQIIAKNSFFLTISEIVTRLISILLVIIIARYLGPVNYGTYSFVFAFTFFFSILIDLGISNLINRELAKNINLVEKFIGNFFLIKVILSLITIPLFYIVAFSLFSENLLILTLSGALIYTIFNSFNQFYIAIFRAFNKMQFEMADRIVEKSVLVIFIILIINYNLGLVAIVSAFMISSIIAMIICIVFTYKYIKKPRYEFDINFIKVGILEALPFSLIIIFQMIYFRIDTIFLEFIKGDAAVGWYNAAYNIVFALMAIASIFESAIFPSLTRLFNTSKDEFDKISRFAFKYLYILGLSISIGTTIVAEQIIILIFGQNFINSIIALQILIWSFFIMCICGIPTLTLTSTGKQRIVAIGMGITAVGNIVLNFILIDKYGITGAAIATIIVCFFEFFFEFYCMNRYVVKISVINKDYLKITVAGILMGVCVYLINAIIIFRIIFGIFIFLLSMFLLNVLSNEDYALIKEILPKKN